MSGLEKFLNGLTNGEAIRSREDVLRFENKEFTVDTCCTPDCGWETAVWRTNEKIVVVEYYKDRTGAEAGHTKWVQVMLKDIKTELKSVQNSMEWAGFYDKLSKEELEKVVRTWDDYMTIIFLLKEQDEELGK